MAGIIGQRVTEMLTNSDTVVLHKIDRKLKSMSTKQLSESILCDIKPTTLKRLGCKIPTNVHAAQRRTHNTSKARTAMTAGRPPNNPFKTAPEKNTRKHNLAQAVSKNQNNWKKH